jgi:hypothetical protein
MPFDWYHYDVPKGYRETFSKKRLSMYLDDMRARATLLRNLGYKKDYVMARLKGNVRWAYEMVKVPEYIEKVEEVVEEVFSKQVPTIR